MEDEIKNLKLEIDVLKKRISYLENKERNRKIIGIIKGIVITVLLILIIIYGYKLLQEMMNYYNQVKDVLNDPLKSLL